MATTEERLAELEAKMAALTTPPDDYYTSRYSGEEIDNGIDRAKSGGAIDKAIQAKANPNLLDNWYFGNPVDQRGGYVVPPGTPYYYMNTNTQVGMTDKYYPADEINLNGAPYITIDGTQYYAQSNSGVRGYVGVGYGIDRWYFDADSGSCTLALTKEGAKFIATAGASGIASLKQVIDPTMLSVFAGKTVTLSILGKTDVSQQALFYVNGQVTAVNASPAVSGVCMTTLTYTFPEVLTDAAIFVYGRSYSGAGEGTILGAKLELGSQQTLAHQDADGNWVLNEIPDYGEQLRRCQRYFQRFTMDGQRFIGTAILDSPLGGQGVINTAVQMRTSPAISGNLCIYNTINNLPCTDFAAKGMGSNGIFVTFSATDISQTPASALLYAGGIVDLSADL